MKNEKISSFSLSTFIIPLSSSSFYGVLSSYVLNTSKTSSIISILIGYITSLIISFIILGIFSTNKELNFTDKIKRAFNRFSIPINIIFTICSLLIYIFLIYRLTAFLSNQYLIETQSISILIIIILLTYYTASKGIETVSRVSTISIIIALFIFIFDASNLIKNININNYLPIIDSSFKNIISSSLISMVYFSAPIIYINAIKKNDLVDKEKFKKYFFIMHFASFIITFTSIFITIGVYGINLASMFDYPLYTVLKKISLFSFLESLENISIMLWLLNIINACNIILLFIFNNIKDMFKLSKKKTNILNILVLLIAFIIPYVFFINNSYVDSFRYIKFPFIISSIVLILSLLTLVFLKIKNKKI